MQVLKILQDYFFNHPVEENQIISRRKQGAALPSIGVILQNLAADIR